MLTRLASLSQSLSFPHHLLSASLSPSRATRREPCDRRKPLACGATPTYDPCASRDARLLSCAFFAPGVPDCNSGADRRMTLIWAATFWCHSDPLKGVEVSFVTAFASLCPSKPDSIRVLVHYSLPTEHAPVASPSNQHSAGNEQLCPISNSYNLLPQSANTILVMHTTVNHATSTPASTTTSIPTSTHPTHIQAITTSSIHKRRLPPTAMSFDSDVLSLTRLMT